MDEYFSIDLFLDLMIRQETNNSWCTIASHVNSRSVSILLTVTPAERHRILEQTNEGREEALRQTASDLPINAL